MENLDDALYAAEQEAQGGGDAFEIIVKKKDSSMKTTLLVYPANNMEQVLMRTAEEIGVSIKLDSEKEHIVPNPRQNLFFENVRTHKSSSALAETVAAMDLISGDTLCISDNADVA